MAQATLLAYLLTYLGLVTRGETSRGELTKGRNVHKLWLLFDHLHFFPSLMYLCDQLRAPSRQSNPIGLVIVLIHFILDNFHIITFFITSITTSRAFTFLLPV